MIDPDILASFEADRLAEERAIEVAREAFAAGTGRRWVRVGGHLHDLAGPARAVEPQGDLYIPTWTNDQPEPVSQMADPVVECCRACGRPLIGGAP